MGTCPVCSMEVAEGEMESHAAMHAGAEGEGEAASAPDQGGDEAM